MADTHAKHHDYHLVDPSPWPLIGSISAFVHGGRRDHLDALTDGAAGLFGLKGPWVFGARLHRRPAAPCSCWWRDVINEANTGDHTRVVQLHLRYGMILFIASEVMFFVAWFWAYFDAALYAGEPRTSVQHGARSVEVASGGVWPPKPVLRRHVRSLGPAACSTR